MANLFIRSSRVAIVAFHLAFLDKPRDPLVVAVFSLAVYNGGDMVEAVEIARKISKSHATIYQELSDHKNLDGKLLKKEVLDLGLSVSKALSNMTNSYYVSRALSNYPKAPYSDLVCVQPTRSLISQFTAITFYIILHNDSILHYYLCR